MAKRRREAAAFGCVCALIAAALVLSLCVGKYPISPGEIGDILLGRPVKELSRSVFFTLRLSRTLMAALSGFGLGLAGAVYQVIFRNPLADPDIIGVVKGANLGAAVAIVALGNHILSVAVSAFAGGLLAVLAVLLLVRATRMTNTAAYILAGIVISAVSDALIMLLKFFADPDKELAAIEFWAMGSFGAVTLDKLTAVAPVFAAGLAGLLLLRRQVGLLAMDEEESKMLGVRVSRVRLGVLVCTTLMVASIVSVVGRVAFLGLIAPHIARLVFGRNNFSTCLFSGCVGCLLLTLADTAARSLYAVELPISVVTTAVGAPVLLFFLCRRKEGRL